MATGSSLYLIASTSNQTLTAGSPGSRWQAARHRLRVNRARLCAGCPAPGSDAEALLDDPLMSQRRAVQLRDRATAPKDAHAIAKARKVLVLGAGEYYRSSSGKRASSSINSAVVAAPQDRLRRKRFGGTSKRPVVSCSAKNSSSSTMGRQTDAERLGRFGGRRHPTNSWQIGLDSVLGYGV